MAVTSSGGVVAIGGLTASSGTARAQTDLRTGSAWANAPSMGFARGYFQASLLDGGLVVATGGWPGSYPMVEVIEKLVVP